jgi:2-polyprenyl-3-methyl-5-hydroxy-6-metoxy-1,4-benzoquinol methylase
MRRINQIFLTILKKICYKCRILNQKKPNPSDYTALIGQGSIVPCQIEAYFLALNDYVAERSSVLDVGFGLGYGLNILAIKAREVSGVEIDEKVLIYCQQTLLGRNPKLRSLKLYDGYNLEYNDYSYDVVTCVDVLEHVEHYDKLLKEMLRVSRKGVFISTPNRRMEYTNPDGTPKNYWHLREWTRDELDPILVKHGPVDWHFINGCWEGPFTSSKVAQDDTLALSPFVYKT